MLISPDLAAAVDWVNLPKAEETLFKSEREAHLAFVGKPYIPSIMEFTHANGRHFGLDVRHPMFDRRIVDFCVGLDPGMKLKDGWTRYVLRAAMSGIVPDTVRWRPGKSTLAPNFDLKMANEAKNEVEDVLRSASGEISQFVRKDSISSLLESGRSRTIWPAVVLASFLKKSF